MIDQPSKRQVGVLPETRRSLSVAKERKNEKQLAIVIGIGDYQGGFPSLANATYDASAVAGLLERDYSFMLWPQGVPLLDDIAKRDSLQAAIASSLEPSTGATRWLFYFAGHGSVLDQEGYLIPVDAHQDNPSAYLPLRWLLDQCLTSECAETLIVLDACYSGRALIKADELSDLISSEHEVGRVRQLIASGNPNQPVLDGGGSGHSIFTQALLEALGGFAGIHDKDGSLRFTPLFDYLALDVPARLAALGLSPDRQQPIGGNLVGNHLRREYVLKPSVPRLPPATVLGMRNEDPRRRRESLEQLSEDCRDWPEIQPIAVQLALQYLPGGPSEKQLPFGKSKPKYEPIVQVRAQAARTLGELGDRSATLPLIQALEDVDEVRQTAARALGKLADPSAAPALLSHLDDTDDALFLDYVSALGAIGRMDATFGALRESLQRDRLVPFLGPDLPQTLTGVPERATLIHDLVQLENLPVSDSFAQTASASLRTGSRFTFTDFLREKFNNPRLQPSDFHLALSKIGASLWINASYDLLLASALGADIIVNGSEAQYFRRDRPTVVQLAGETSSPNNLLVLEEDYSRLRTNEHQRQALTTFLRQQLTGKVILFLGCDPTSHDFGLIHQYILNQYLAGVHAQAFLIWPGEYPTLDWDGRKIYPIVMSPQEILPLLLKWDFES